MNTTTCSVCRRPTKVDIDGQLIRHLRLHEGKLQRCPGGKG